MRVEKFGPQTPVEIGARPELGACGRRLWLSRTGNSTSSGLEGQSNAMSAEFAAVHGIEIPNAFCGCAQWARALPVTVKPLAARAVPTLPALLGAARISSRLAAWSGRDGPP